MLVHKAKLPLRSRKPTIKWSRLHGLCAHPRGKSSLPFPNSSAVVGRMAYMF